MASKTPKKKEESRFWDFFKVGAITAVVGVAAYEGVKYAKKKGVVDKYFPVSETQQVSQTTTTSYSPAPSVSVQASSGSASFPLKNGSKGDLVYQLQTALSKKFPSAAALLDPVKSQWGNFGGVTEKALMSAGFSTVIDKATFDKIVGTSSVAVATGSVSDIVKSAADAFVKLLTARDARGNKTEFTIATANTSVFDKIGSSDRATANRNWLSFEAYFNKTAASNGLKSLLDTFLERNDSMNVFGEKDRFNWHIKRLQDAKTELGMNGLGFAGTQLFTIMDTMVRGEDGSTHVIPKGFSIGTELASQDGFILFADKKGNKGVVDANMVSYA